MPPLLVDRAARVWGISSLVVALIGVGGVLGWKHVQSSRAAAHAAAALSASVARGDPVLRVPQVPGAITLDGDTDDPGWLRPPGPARTGDFVLPNGKQAVPYSATKLVWGDGFLYVALYASDLDIETHTDQPDGPVWLEDAFRVVFFRPGVEYELDLSPKAVISDSIRRDGGARDFAWSSGAHASKEMDGSLNNPKDRDEEWAIELAVPLESLEMQGEPGETIGLSLSRCDTLNGAPPVCAGWGDGADGRAKGTIVLQ
jgi:hypothetical protein